MSIVSVFRAIIYRELRFLKRMMPEYMSLAFQSTLFALSIIGIAMSVSGVSGLVAKFSQIFNISGKVSLTDIIAAALAFSGLLSLTADCVGSVSQVIIYEANVIDILHLIAQSTYLYLYYMTYALIYGLLSGIVSTLYVLVLLVVGLGAYGAYVYLMLLPAYIVTGIALSYYTLVVTLPLTYIVKMRRYWAISQVLVPVLIAGSGIFIPVSLVPLFLRVISYTSPLPEVCTILQEMFFKAIQSPIIFLMFTAVFVIYIALSTYISYKTEKLVRRGL
ncbi:MAG: hypothetical protein GXO23_02200 [Crenarchaeota archaeon]|nr:hypothetical protein [Thermoproteota archaeon]